MPNRELSGGHKLMHPFIWIGAALGGLAFWRRKHLKEDAEKVTAVAKDAKAAATSRVAVARSGRKSLLVQLGEAVYASRTDPGGDATAEIDRLVGDLEELDAALDEAGEDAGDEQAEDAPAE
jgi:hypothetical protein